MEIGTTETPLAKLHKLKYIIDGVYEHRLDDTGNLKIDKNWVVGEIHNLRNDGWLSATKMKVANEMWSKYGG
jgi:hypothetical protein